MIKRRKLREFYVLRREIALCIDRELAHSICPAFVDGNNLAITYVRNRVRALENFERLTRLIVHFEIARHAQSIPDRWVFAAESIDRKSARLVIAHFAQFVKKRHGV